MKRTAYLTAAYLAFVTLSLLTVFFGKTGVGALQRLAAERAAQSENLQGLESTYRDLTQRLGDLRTNPQSIIVEARGLGLVKPGERMIHFNGTEASEALPDPGRVLRAGKATGADEGLFRLLAFIVGVTVVLAALIGGRARGSRPAE